MLLLELRQTVVHEALVEVLAAEMRVAGRGAHFEDTIVDGQQGDIEGTAA